MHDTRRHIKALLAELVKDLLESPLPTNGLDQLVPSQDPVAHISMDLEATGFVPVVILPEINISKLRAVVLSIAVDSRPDNRFISVANEASVMVASVAVAYDILKSGIRLPYAIRKISCSTVRDL